jgi:periplasmic divalent cation tolerance protein
MNEYLQVFTTTETREEAQAVARAVVEQRLAGCVQVVGPISSTYWWEGEITQAEEYLCLIKTRRSLFVQVEAAIRAVHPYEVPEILAMPVAAGNQDYLDWLGAELNGSRYDEASTKGSR